MKKAILFVLTSALCFFVASSVVASEIGLPDIKTLHSTLVSKDGKVLAGAQCEVMHDWAKALLEKPKGPLLKYSHSISTDNKGGTVLHANKGSLLSCYHGGKLHLGAVDDLKAKSITMHSFSLGMWGSFTHAVSHAANVVHSTANDAGNKISGAARGATGQVIKTAHNGGNVLLNAGRKGVNLAEKYHCEAYNGGSLVPGVGTVTSTVAQQAACRLDKACKLVPSYSSKFANRIGGFAGRMTSMILEQCVGR